MFISRRFAFSISQLGYTIEGYEIASKFQVNNKFTIPIFLMFHNKALPSSKLFSSYKKVAHEHLFRLYLEYLTKCSSLTKEQQKSQYSEIQQHLRLKVSQEIKKHHLSLKILKSQFQSSKLIEHRKLEGVFLHRKVNLGQKCYEIKQTNPAKMQFKMKNIVRESELRDYERKLRIFVKDELQSVYSSNYEEFIKKGYINRFLYKVDAEVQLELTMDGKQLVLGREGPTSHLLQVESITDHYSFREQFYLTDIDFILAGNYHLQK